MPPLLSTGCWLTAGKKSPPFFLFFLFFSFFSLSFRLLFPSFPLARLPRHAPRSHRKDDEPPPSSPLDLVSAVRSPVVRSWAGRAEEDTAAGGGGAGEGGDFGRKSYTMLASTKTKQRLERSNTQEGSVGTVQARPSLSESVRQLEYNKKEDIGLRELVD